MPFPPPKLPVEGFPDLRPVRPKTQFPGGLRRRWKDPAGRIYEWDYPEYTIEP
jgi:hypothetical protein